MILKTERLILRPWDKADAENLYNVAKDPNVGPRVGWSVHTSPENSLEIITNVLSKPNIFAAVLKETGKPVGSVGLHIGEDSNIIIDEGEGELGYWIGSEYWGRGLIPEAAYEIIRYGFSVLKLSRIWCIADLSNHNSIRVMEKLGFTESIEKKKMRYPRPEDAKKYVSYMDKQYQ